MLPGEKKFKKPKTGKEEKNETFVSCWTFPTMSEGKGMSCPAPSDLLCSLLTAYLKMIRNVERCCPGTMNITFPWSRRLCLHRTCQWCCAGGASKTLCQGEQRCQPSPGQGARRHGSAPLLHNNRGWGQGLEDLHVHGTRSQLLQNKAKQAPHKIPLVEKLPLHTWDCEKT